MPAGYAVHLLEVVRELGGDPDPLIKRAQLDPQVLRDPDGLVRFDQVAAMLLAARVALDEPRIGLLLGSRLSVTAHGVLGFAAMSCGTPREALDLILRYLHTRTPVSALEIDTAQDDVILRLHEQYTLGIARELYMEVVAAAVVSSLRFLLSGRIEGFQLAFPYPAPAHAAEYGALLGTVVSFGAARLEIRVPAACLDLRMPLADPVAKEKAARQCEEELRRLEGQVELTDRIRQLLTPCRRQFPGQAEMARRLCLSERTLRRRLQQRATSYRALLDEVRCQLALEMLAEPGRNVNTIAYDLGYDDASNFSRAFRRWTGHSPGQCRRPGEAS